jgi:tetratricopeptide (TPR) repeat protein
VIAQRPTDADAYHYLGLALVRLGQHEQGIAAYRDALRLRPDWPDAMNDLAWLLVTAPDEKLRDYKEAAALAGGAYQTSREREPLFLDTMAAAQAQTGDFKGALATQQRAIEVARAIGNDKLVAELEKRLKPYSEGRAYRPEQGQTRPATAPVK